MGVIFEWNGEALIRKTEAAQKTGLANTAGEIVPEAQSRVRVLSGDLQGDIQILGGVEATGSGFEVYVGSENLDYAAIQEQGPADGRPYAYTPYLRPARDIHAPNLAAEIKGAM